MTAKVEMKSWNADVSPAAAAAVMAGATMTRAVSTAMTGTRPVRLVATVPGVVATAMPGAVMTGAATVAGTVPAAAGAMTGTVAAPMAGTAGMMISRLNSGRSENGKAGGDSQESNELFHCKLVLIRCRQMSGLSQQTKCFQDYSDDSFFS